MTASPSATVGSMTGDAPITVGISTHDRPDSLARAVRSLRRIHPMVAEVIVVDDGSPRPAEAALRAALGADAPPRLTVLRMDAPGGPAAARNRIAERARTPLLLFMDDDAAILAEQAIADAVGVLAADPRVAAIAFAQADAEGRPFPAQPAPVEHPAYVQTYIGFAHLIRRDAMLGVGGYREILEINGEERELCLRLLDAGFRVVYLPRARVAHLADPSGRGDSRRFLYLCVRNDALTAMMNEPLPMALASVPVRLRRYFVMRDRSGIVDPGGFRRILGDLAAAMPQVVRDRRGVRWATMREWRRLASAPAYHPPERG